MNPILTIIGALLPFVTSELQQFKLISPNVGNLITGIEGAATVFVGALTAPGATASPSVTFQTLLGAIAAAVSILKTELPTDGTAAKVLLYITALESAIAAGVGAEQAVTEVDLGKLQPVEAA